MNPKKENIDLKTLKAMFINGSEVVGKHYEFIDELNVFPVPDGDTGINMKITFEGGVSSINSSNANNIRDLSLQFARGLLMNARGNSGVITSQIFKGFADKIPEGCTSIDCKMLVSCFEGAKEKSYSAVSNPIEGTMLTIIRIISEESKKIYADYKNIEDFFAKIIEIAEYALSRTPTMLLALKEAGVVDSGGYGICKFLQGMYNVFNNSEKSLEDTKQVNNSIKKTGFVKADDNNDGFGYCNEFLMRIGSKVEYNQKNKKNFNLSEFKAGLEKLGDSIVLVVDSDIVKVHIHSLYPYQILEFGAQYGEFEKVKIENMTLQFLEKNPGTTLESLHFKHNVNAFDVKTKKPVIVSTVPGETFAKIYEQKFDIKSVIDTDKNGNPSIQDFLTCIKKTKSSNIIIVIDDNNFFLAANECVKLLPKEFKAKIIQCENITESYDICHAFNSADSLSDNIKRMKKLLGTKLMLKVSHSIKDIKYSNISIKKGDYIGIQKKKILSSNPDITTAVMKMVECFSISKYNHVTVFYGNQMKEDVAKNIVTKVCKEYNLKNDLINGGQDTYYLMFCFSKSN